MAREIVFMSRSMEPTDDIPTPVIATEVFSMRDIASDYQLQLENLLVLQSCIKEGTFRSFEKYINWFSCRASHIAVAQDGNGELVSSALLLPVGTRKLPGFEAHLEYVMTHPQKRGIGGARSVVCALLQKAQELGLGYVYLTCKPELVGMYGRMGFQVNQRCTLPD